MIVLKLENVSIRYKVGDIRNIGLKETIVRKLRGTYRITDFWADRDVSFSLEQGDMRQRRGKVHAAQGYRRDHAAEYGND